MKKHLLFYTLLVLFAVAVTACGKKGCTDPDSTNYNADAKKDDGTCTYDAQAMFYLGDGTYDSLEAAEHYDLRLILNNEDLGMVNIGFMDNEPDCSGFLSSAETIDMGSNKSMSIPYEVKDDDTGESLFKGEKTIQANTCNGIELKY